MSTRCPKVGDKQWSCTGAECTCHMKMRVLFFERMKDKCGAPCDPRNEHCSCLAWAEERSK